MTSSCRRLRTRAREPDWVVLHDADDRIAGEATERRATIEQVEQWAYAAWERLGGCAKYLRRGSLWEALEQLHAARADAWRLWAAAQGVRDPQYGLTAVLDSPTTPLPPEIDSTVATLDARDLTRAALACADLVTALWPQATSAVGDPRPPPPLAPWVRSDLSATLSLLPPIEI